jgi:glycosyltransferase involved in cell wall biosynthesis
MAAYEVIVVDDGSNDGTVDYLKGLENNLILLTQSNRGPGSARNRGLEHARGRYVAFLDSDDLWLPWTLETYSTIADEHDSPAFIAGKPYRFDAVEKLQGLGSEPVTCLQFADYLASGDEWRWWGVSSFVLRADAIRAAGGFSEENMNGEDADLALKLGEAPGFVQVLSPFTFGYREHAASVMKDLSKTIAGARHLIESERRGAYPGGAARALERWRILTRHLRPVSLDCLAGGRRRDAWELYRSTLRWNMSLGRWKYMLGFPVRAGVWKWRSRRGLWQQAA